MEIDYILHRLVFPDKEVETATQSADLDKEPQPSIKVLEALRQYARKVSTHKKPNYFSSQTWRN